MARGTGCNTAFYFFFFTTEKWPGIEKNVGVKEKKESENDNERVE